MTDMKTKIILNKECKSILLHTLGLSFRNPIASRGYYICSKGTSDHSNIEELCRIGLMKLGQCPSFCNTDDILYHATEDGKKHAYELLRIRKEKLPKLTRSQKRYQQYLKSDGCESFGEWIKGNMYKPYESRY